MSLAPLIKGKKPLPSLTFGDECLPVKKLYENVKMCYKYSKYCFSCHLQMLNWKVKNVKSQVELAELIDQRLRFISLNW